MNLSAISQAFTFVLRSINFVVHVPMTVKSILILLILWENAFWAYWVFGCITSSGHWEKNHLTVISSLVSFPFNTSRGPRLALLSARRRHFPATFSQLWRIDLLCAQLRHTLNSTSSVIEWPLSLTAEDIRD